MISSLPNRSNSSARPILRLLSRLVLASLLVSATILSPAQEEAEPEEEHPLAQLDWVTEGKGELGKWATINIPPGFGFVGGDDTRKLMTMMGNLETGTEVGTLMNFAENWFIVYEFDPMGYVKDDEKDELDADKMMAEMKENQKASNEYRVEQGFEPMSLSGWIRPPFYNEETNNLEWGIRIKSKSGESANYLSKLLGRRGVMDATLVCNPEDMEALLPRFQSILANYEYVDGQKYAQFTDGDKIAKYGLTALVVGGGAAVAAKAGLFAVIAKFFAKAWKLLVVGLIGVVAAFKRLFWRGAR